jgi:hypothetical protein
MFRISLLREKDAKQAKIPRSRRLFRETTKHRFVKTRAKTSPIRQPVHGLAPFEDGALNRKPLQLLFLVLELFKASVLKICLFSGYSCSWSTKYSKYKHHLMPTHPIRVKLCLFFGYFL